jgi:hypothetical protein
VPYVFVPEKVNTVPAGPMPALAVADMRGARASMYPAYVAVLLPEAFVTVSETS